MPSEIERLEEELRACKEAKRLLEDRKFLYEYGFFTFQRNLLGKYQYFTEFTEPDQWHCLV